MIATRLPTLKTNVYDPFEVNAAIAIAACRRCTDR